LIDFPIFPLENPDGDPLKKARGNADAAAK
jgi:hypothetical protein